MSRRNGVGIRNASGYTDMTAFKAIKHADRASLDESDRFHKLLDTILYIIKLAGFEVEGRIVLKDKRTGRIWR